MSQGTTELVARFALTTASIPADVRSIGIEHLIDSVAVMLAGAAEASGTIVRRHLRDLGGPPQATILGTSVRAPLQSAAWANGVAGHAMDYDDTQLATDRRSVYGLLTHPSVPVLAAALAVAEDTAASGRDLLTAYILGVEITCRIADSIAPRHYGDGLHSTGTMGGFGAAAAAARLWACDLDQLRRALGLAASMGAGLRENFGTMTKPFHAGRAAENGILAVALSRGGWTAATNILEAKRGFFNATAGGYDASKIDGRMGRPYFFIEPGISIKPYPSGSLSHPAQDVLLRLVREHDLLPAEIARIDVGVNSHVPDALIHARPATGLEGKFSLPYQMAVGIIDRRAGIAQFQDRRVGDPAVRTLMERVHVAVDPDIEAQGYNEMRMTVAITLADGRRLSGYADKARGHPKTPLSADELREKFTECAALVMPVAQAETLLQHLWGIEHIEDVRDLVPMMRGTL